MATAVKSTKKPEQGGVFRVLIGEHVGYGPAGCECDACLKTPVDERQRLGGRGKNHRYRARLPSDSENWDGDLIESEFDLELRFNQGFSRKFARVYQGEQQYAAPPAPYPLDKMSLPQLLAYAEEEEIDVKGLKARDEVLKALKAAGK